MKYTGLAVAAVLAVCVTVPLASRNSPAGKTGSGIRVKGNKMNGQSLHLYRQSQDGANLLKDGTFASEDDVIQIAYLPGDKTYGIIFSVDGNGNISRHFPEESWQAQKLELTGNEVPLDFSYKLDAAPDYECFVFVASKEPFSLENIQNLSKKECSVEYLKKGKYSPEGCSSFVFVLNKN